MRSRLRPWRSRLFPLRQPSQARPADHRRGSREGPAYRQVRSKPHPYLEVRRKRAGLTRFGLAELLRLSGMKTTASTIERLENSKMNLTHSYIVSFASIFKVAESEITGEANGRENVTVKNVPVLSWDETGSGLTMRQLADRATQPFPTDRPSVLATRVVGTAMNRFVPPGTMIIYDPEDKDPVEGKRYLIRASGDVLFRQYTAQGGPARFEPDSTEKHDTIYQGIVTVPVIGRVIHFVGDA
jgi:hypothetical protein